MYPNGYAPAESRPDDASRAEPAIHMTKADTGSQGKRALRKTMRVQATKPPEGMDEKMFKAAALGQIVTLEMLLPKATNVDCRDAKGRTALIWAAANGHPSVVNLLLDRGANIEAKDELGRTPLMWASENGHIATVRVLLQRGANIHSKDKEMATALTLASAKDHKQIVNQLTQAGAVLGSWNNWNASPRARPLRQMPGGVFDSGAQPAVAVGSINPKIKRNEPGPARRVEAEKAAPPARSLKTIPVNVTRARVEHGQLASLGDAISISLEEKLDELARNSDYSRSYIRAFAIPLMTKGKVRIDKGDHVERIGMDPKNLLDHEEAEDLLESYLITLPQEAKEAGGGARGEAQASYAPGALSVETSAAGDEMQGGAASTMPPGNAAMMRAAMEGRTTTLKILIEEGADINIRLLDGWTPLMCSVWNGHGESVKILLELGADLEARGANGWTALMIAAWNGHPDIVQQLVEEGANVHACDETGKTVLMWAVQNGNPASVKILLAKKVDVNAMNNRGKTALYYAAREEHPAIVKLLEKAGAKES